MESFATVSDLEVRWRELDETESNMAETLLNDASAYIASMLSRSDVEIDENDDIQSANLKTVACSMVKRIMAVDDEFFGVTQFSKTAGSFTASGTASNPNGDMYMTSSEKSLLGIPSSGKKQRAVFVRPHIGYGINKIKEAADA